MTGKTKAKRVWLACDHTIWFKDGRIAPRQGEFVWCVKCQDYETVGEPQENAETYHPDYEWTSKPIGAVQHLGRCTQAECSFEARGTFEKVRAKMEVHHIVMHRNSSLLLPREEKIPEKLPPNSPPPF